MNFSKLKERNSDLSRRSSMRADSESEKPFFLRKSNTDSMPETDMRERIQKKSEGRRVEEEEEEEFMGLG